MVVVTTGIVVSTDYETVVLDLECCHSVPPLPQDGREFFVLDMIVPTKKSKSKMVANSGSQLWTVSSL